MTQKELAREIVVERGRALRDGRRIPYYLVNINHPAISALYNAYKSTARVPSHFPPSDIERTLFELSLLNETAITALRAHYNSPELRPSPIPMRSPHEQYRDL